LKVERRGGVEGRLLVVTPYEDKTTQGRDMGRNSDDRSAGRDWIVKAAEIGICCTLLALILRDTHLVPTAVAYPLGILLGCIGVYFVPPRTGPRFRIWVAVSALMAALLFIYEILVS